MTERSGFWLFAVVLAGGVVFLLAGIASMPEPLHMRLIYIGLSLIGLSLGIVMVCIDAFLRVAANG